MSPILKFFVRTTLIFILILFYLKYRNNQCINNQNCEPIFISKLLSFKKNFDNVYPIIYKINDNLANIDVLIETSFTRESAIKNNFKKEDIENYLDTTDYYKKNGYGVIDFVNNNDIIFKKISLKNTSNIPVLVHPKMTFNPNIYKIYNCFCDSKIIVNPMSIKDIYIYFEFKEPKQNKLNQANSDAFSNEEKVILISI